MTHLQGVWNWPHKFHLYLTLFILPLPLTNSLMDDRLGNWLFKNLPPYHINIWCTPCPKITFIPVKIFILCGSKDLSFENWIILGLEFFANLKQCCDNWDDSKLTCLPNQTKDNKCNGKVRAGPKHALLFVWIMYRLRSD